jgi:hypothetical protein
LNVQGLLVWWGIDKDIQSVLGYILLDNDFDDWNDDQENDKSYDIDV